DRTAIDYYGRATSYRALHQAALNLAGYMQQRLGVRRGDRVLILMQNCPQFAIAYYAILRCDAVVVSMSPMSTPDEIAHYVQDSGGGVVITMQDLQQRVEPFLADGRLAGCIVGAYSQMAGCEADVPFMQIPAFVLERRRVEDDPARRPEVHDFAGALAAGIAPTSMNAQPADLAVIGYTSGTTGKPKGAMLSHRAFSLVVAQRSLWLPGGEGCSDLVILPITHVAGMGAMNQSLCEGRTMALLARWDAPAVPMIIERRRIDRWAAVTPMLVELLGRPELARHDLSSLKRLYGGATAMPEAVAREVEQRFGVPFIECYGMTETCGSTH
ncbi:MAG: AMP-binding protein, partial [Rhizobacter sp.]